VVVFPGSRRNTRVWVFEARVPREDERRSYAALPSFARPGPAPISGVGRARHVPGKPAINPVRAGSPAPPGRLTVARGRPVVPECLRRKIHVIDRPDRARRNWTEVPDMTISGVSGALSDVSRRPRVDRREAPARSGVGPENGTLSRSAEVTASQRYHHNL